MLVTKNEVQAEEDLACMLWDSDKRSNELSRNTHYRC